MLCMDNEAKTLKLFEDAENAYMQANNPLAALMPGKLGTDSQKKTWDEYKKQIIDNVMWFEFQYYLKGGKYMINRPDADLGKGLSYVYDRNAFYLDGKYISNDEAYNIVSNNGALDAYTVAANLDRIDGINAEKVKEALGVYDKAEWK